MQPFSGAEFQQRFSQVQGQVQVGAERCRMMVRGAERCREVQRCRGAEVQIQQSGEVQRYTRCAEVMQKWDRQG